MGLLYKGKNKFTWLKDTTRKFWSITFDGTLFLCEVLPLIRIEGVIAFEYVNKALIFVDLWFNGSEMSLLVNIMVYLSTFEIDKYFLSLLWT